MKGALWGGGGVVAAAVMLPLLLVGAVSGQESVRQSVSTGGLLNAALIPAEYVALVQAAGSMCEGESAPLIAAQIQAESGWNPTALSPAGAQGIAQFMPGTWATWGKDYNHDGVANVFDPADAIPSQGAFMCALFGEVNSAMSSGRIARGTAKENALAAYNAGMGNVLASGGFPTGIGETDAYVPRILALELQLTLTTTVAGDWALPLPAGSYSISSPFGLRFHPIYHEWRLHNGVDLAAPEGTPIFAACAGTVVSTAWDSGGGGMVTTVDCGGGVQTLYMHQSAYKTVPGAVVPAGQLIGLVGNTGGSTGAHLHFTVKVAGTPVDPVPYMAAKGVPL